MRSFAIYLALACLSWPVLGKEGKGRPMMELMRKHGVGDKESKGLPADKFTAFARKLGASDDFDWKKHDADGNGVLSKKEAKFAFKEIDADWKDKAKENLHWIEEL